MSTPDDAPQTVGEATKNGWNYLGVACGHCRRGRTRVDLTKQPPWRLLSEVARKCWCRRCGPIIGRSYLTFELIAIWTNERSKPIGFAGTVATKIGMN